jgi:hypothetical protein
MTSERERARKAQMEISKCEKELTSIVSATNIMKKDIEEAISKLFNNKVVTISGINI